MNFYNLFCNTMYLCVYIYMYLASIYVSPSLSYVCVFAPFPAPVMAAIANHGPAGYI